MTPETIAAETDKRHEASARHAAAVKDLLDRRDDLAGTIPLADLIHDATTWVA